jgi:hypothetical protein
MQGIVIQGPLTFYKEIVECYKHIPNIVISTWDDEDIKHINYIKNNNIPIVLSAKPNNPGYLNINMQTVSTMAGIHYLEQIKVTEILKVRTDIITTNIDKLLSILNNKSLAFLGICKPNVRPLEYYIEYNHSSFDFPINLMEYGNLENIKNLFNFTIENYTPIPPESLLSYNYFKSNDLEFKLDYDYFIKNNIYFYLNDCIQHNIDFLWLKRNSQSIVEMHKDKTLYNY